MISFDDKPGVYADAPVGVHISLHVGPYANTKTHSISTTPDSFTLYGVKFFFDTRVQMLAAISSLYLKANREAEG